jgi:hypothetical protein
MEHKGIVAAAIVLVLLIVGMFIFAYLERKNIGTEPANLQTPPTEEETSYPEITRINAKHFYIDGTHTLAGEILFPTPCDLLNWDTTIAESFPEQVMVNFTVANYADTCAQVVTPQRFKIDFVASEKATIRARFEGRTIELNLLPAAPDENPDAFELFIKG